MTDGQIFLAPNRFPKHCKRFPTPQIVTLFTHFREFHTLKIIETVSVFHSTTSDLDVGLDGFYLTNSENN